MGRQTMLRGSDPACAFVREQETAVQPAGRESIALPARLDLSDRAMSATIDRGRVVFRRGGEGRPPLYITVPLSSYRGVVLTRTGEEGAERLALVLRHANGELDLPLLDTDNDDDIVADWQAWASVLGCRPLIEDADGTLTDPWDRFGGLVVSRPRARRANAFFRQRRPRKLMTRQVGGEPVGCVRGEREIIARD